MWGSKKDKGYKFLKKLEEEGVNLKEKAYIDVYNETGVYDQEGNGFTYEFLVKRGYFKIKEKDVADILDDVYWGLYSQIHNSNKGCIDCFRCEDCDFCISCVECVGCTGCTNCKDCRFCVKCKNCELCHSCCSSENCTNCYDCNKIKDCSNKKGEE